MSGLASDPWVLVIVVASIVALGIAHRFRNSL
jgi:hypothetical protein